MAKEQVAITEWANGQVCQHKVSKFAEPAKITFVNLSGGPDAVQSWSALVT